MAAAAVTSGFATEHLASVLVQVTKSCLICQPGHAAPAAIEFAAAAAAVAAAAALEYLQEMWACMLLASGLQLDCTLGKDAAWQEAVDQQLDRSHLELHQQLVSTVGC